MLRIKKVFAGSYAVISPDGDTLATIENHEVAELPAREWLVTFYHYCTGIDAWDQFDADYTPTLKAGKVLALDWARRILIATAND